MNQEDYSNHLPETPIMQLHTHILAPVQRKQVTERANHKKNWVGKKISLEQTSTQKTRRDRKRQGRVKGKEEENAVKKRFLGENQLNRFSDFFLLCRTEASFQCMRKK